MTERRRPTRVRGEPADDLLAGSVEALAVLLDAGIAPASAWHYVAAEATHPAVIRAAALVAAGIPPAEALVEAADGGASAGRGSGGERAASASRDGGAEGDSGTGLASAAVWRGERAADGFGVDALVRSAQDAGGDYGVASLASWAPSGGGAGGGFAVGQPATSARRRRAAADRSKTAADPAWGRSGGSDGMAAVAAAWIVAEYAGAALAPALRGAAEALRDRADAERDIDTALAGPRATARLMTWLPAVGVAMAYAIGVDVVGTLVTTPLGWAAAVLGGGLLLGGRAWTRRLVASASRAGPVAGIGHDLMAIALAGGMSVAAARETIQDAVRRLGLNAIAEGGTSVDKVLRIAERAGAPAIELLAAEARQERRTARAMGRRRAELLAVRLLLPLGVCVLPAFVLLGVAPVILAMLSSTFSSLT
jgi:tight adherence protein B